MSAIEVRHQKSCRTARGEGMRCNCTPSYRAAVWSPRDRRRIRKTFPTLAAAKRWRADAESAVGRGSLRASRKVTLRDAAEEWLAGVEAGTVRNRSGDPYKPSVRRSYEESLRLHVLPRLGGVPLAELRRVDIQDFADELLAKGRSPSNVANAVKPIRAICRRAVEREVLAVNPTAGLRLPAIRSKRATIVPPEVAVRMLDALCDQDRPIYATAFYAGLRAGELQALRWEDIDMAGGVIRVERGWDKFEGPQAPKTRSSRRTVPLVPVLRDVLLTHRLRQGRSGCGLVFGRTEQTPFAHPALLKRAERVWAAVGLDYVKLHDARHTFASLLIAAGEDPKRIQSYLGHSSITVTFDRYGHLFPGSERESAERLGAFLEQADRIGQERRAA
ncbi:MAG: tyrosine-type recombinase/integrase [Solirubrobacterales bacterium]